MSIFPHKVLLFIISCILRQVLADIRGMYHASFIAALSLSNKHFEIKTIKERITQEENI